MKHSDSNPSQFFPGALFCAERKFAEKFPHKCSIVVRSVGSKLYSHVQGGLEVTLNLCGVSREISIAPLDAVIILKSKW